MPRMACHMACQSCRTVKVRQVQRVERRAPRLRQKVRVRRLLRISRMARLGCSLGRENGLTIISCAGCKEDHPLQTIACLDHDADVKAALMGCDNEGISNARDRRYT